MTAQRLRSDIKKCEELILKKIKTQKDDYEGFCWTFFAFDLMLFRSSMYIVVRRFIEKRQLTYLLQIEFQLELQTPPTPPLRPCRSTGRWPRRRWWCVRTRRARARGATVPTQPRSRQPSPGWRSSTRRTSRRPWRNRGRSMRGENIIDDRYHSTVVYCTYITFISSMIGFFFDDSFIKRKYGVYYF